MLYKVLINNTPHPVTQKLMDQGDTIELFHTIGNPLTVGAAAVLEKITLGGSGAKVNVLEQVIHNEINNKLPELLNDNTGIAAITATVTATNPIIGETVEDIEIEVTNTSNMKAHNVKVFFDLAGLLIDEVSENTKIIDTTACWRREVLPVGGKMNVTIKVTSLSGAEQDVIRAVTVEGFNTAPAMASIDLHLNERVLPPVEETEAIPE